MSNKITELFQVKYPIIQAGMVWCSGWRLASAVSNAGGLGIIGAGSMYPDVLRKHIQKCKLATNKPFAVNVPLLYPNVKEIMDILIEEDVKIGPLINRDAVEKMEGFIKDVKVKGGHIMCGGERLNDYFFPPTVIKNATTNMDIAKKEIFGPIAPMFIFKTDEEALKMANDTEFGLAAYFYTNDLNRSIRVSEALEYGMVGINAGVISSEVAPFGGVKHSGYGREGSVFGLEDFVELKYICTGNVK